MANFVVNGAVSKLAALGSNNGPQVVTVNKVGVTANIQTDDSMKGLVYASETPNTLLFSYSEFILAQARQALGLPVFDELAVQVRGRLGQAPLAPTILYDTVVLPPMVELDLGRGGGGVPAISCWGFSDLGEEQNSASSKLSSRIPGSID